MPSRRRNAKSNARVVIEPGLHALITISTVPAQLFLNGNPPLGGLPVSSLSEPLLLSIFATAGEDLRAEAAAKVQRITRGWQVGVRVRARARVRVRPRHHARPAGAHSDSTSGVRVPCCA